MRQVREYFGGGRKSTIALKVLLSLGLLIRAVSKIRR
jgi:hypothetical protein